MFRMGAVQGVYLKYVALGAITGISFPSFSKTSSVSVHAFACPAHPCLPMPAHACMRVVLDRFYRSIHHQELLCRAHLSGPGRVLRVLVRKHTTKRPATKHITSQRISPHNAQRPPPQGICALSTPSWQFCSEREKVCYLAGGWVRDVYMWVCAWRVVCGFIYVCWCVRHGIDWERCLYWVL